MRSPVAASGAPGDTFPITRPRGKLVLRCWQVLFPLGISLLSLLALYRTGAAVTLLPLLAALAVFRELRALDPCGCVLDFRESCWQLRGPGGGCVVSGDLRCRGRFPRAVWLELRGIDQRGRSRRRDILLLRAALSRRDWSLLRRRLTLLGL